jgi:hypothetical protein
MKYVFLEFSPHHHHHVADFKTRMNSIFHASSKCYLYSIKVKRVLNKENLYQRRKVIYLNYNTYKRCNL